MNRTGQERESAAGARRRGGGARDAAPRDGAPPRRVHSLLGVADARSLVTGLGVLGILAGRQRLDGPERLRWGLDRCDGCEMRIEDPSFAVQLLTPGGARHRFDDIGCALGWLEDQALAGEPGVKVWVARHADGQWIDARTAAYTDGHRSPVGFGHAAGDAGGDGLTFEALGALVRAAGSGPGGIVGGSPLSVSGTPAVTPCDGGLRADEPPRG